MNGPRPRGYVSIALCFARHVALLSLVTHACVSLQAGWHPPVVFVQVPVSFTQASPVAHELARQGPSSSTAMSEKSKSGGPWGDSTFARASEIFVRVRPPLPGSRCMYAMTGFLSTI